jgi:hypothetical protein
MRAHCSTNIVPTSPIKSVTTTGDSSVTVAPLVEILGKTVNVQIQMFVFNFTQNIWDGCMPAALMDEPPLITTQGTKK